MLGTLDSYKKLVSTSCTLNPVYQQVGTLRIHERRYNPKQTKVCSALSGVTSYFGRGWAYVLGSSTFPGLLERLLVEHQSEKLFQSHLCLVWICASQQQSKEYLLQSFRVCKKPRVCTCQCCWHDTMKNAAWFKNCSLALGMIVNQKQTILSCFAGWG